MVGALVSWTVVTLLGDTGWPGWVLLSLSLMAAMAVCMALNYAIEKLAYRPLRNAPRLAPLITAMGMSLLQTMAMDFVETRLQALPHPAQRRAL
jgi:branched-chain amino acid transport system permease protein